MIRYRRSGLEMVEFYLDECLPDLERLHADVVRCMYRSQPLSGMRAETTYTIGLDLSQSEEQLLADMAHMSRRQIRGAEQHHSFRYEILARGRASNEVLSEFGDFYDRFALNKGLRPLYRPRLGLFSDAGMLDISRVCQDDGPTLVWHVALTVEDRVMLLHMPSVLPEASDVESRNQVGRANRGLHWFNIRRHRVDGVRTYDLGGYPIDRRSPEKQGIATFKESLGGEFMPVYSHEIPQSARGRLALPLMKLRHGRPISAAIRRELMGDIHLTGMPTANR